MGGGGQGMKAAPAGGRCTLGARVPQGSWADPAAAPQSTWQGHLRAGFRAPQASQALAAAVGGDRAGPGGGRSRLSAGTRGAA